MTSEGKGPIVEVAGLVHRYESLVDAPPVLDGLDLEVQHGESLAIVGPSGSGKSTLLYVIGALMPPSSGRVAIGGKDLRGLDERELAELRNASIGYVFQAHHLLPQCTALENVLIPTLVHGDSSLRASAVERAKTLLADVGLAERMGHRPAQLSGGERQRVAVVRALINEPQLLLADEPTGSLDADSADQLADLLAEINERQGVALVTVTHSERLARRMERTLELRHGKLAALAAGA